MIDKIVCKKLIVKDEDEKTNEEVKLDLELEVDYESSSSSSSFFTNLSSIPSIIKFSFF
jgi:hypothetical protein